ncbi:MAG TPA: c-type cytochrome [Gammaproteobacteria bacterium]|nr:c-type cytochrome [Gammaproteobacteria bacterium]
MKITYLLSAILAGSFLSVTMANAGGHEIPTAPDEYLKMENPYAEADEDVLKAAGKLYKRKCKKCHGSKGDGKGSSAADLEIKPPDFTKPGYLAGIKDGQLYWVLLKGGSEEAEMEAYGPGTDANISEDDLWKLVTYIRTNFSK